MLQAKVAVLGALGPARGAAALVAAHAASRWSSLPLLWVLPYLQDEEDAKRHLYNWWAVCRVGSSRIQEAARRGSIVLPPTRYCRFAQSRRLLTPPRLAFATLSAAGALVAALPPAQALAAGAAVLVVTVLAGYYSNLVLGGVVGDYLGATIQVAELAGACWCGGAGREAAASDGGAPESALTSPHPASPLLQCTSCSQPTGTLPPCAGSRWPRWRSWRLCQSSGAAASSPLQTASLYVPVRRAVSLYTSVTSANLLLNGCFVKFAASVIDGVSCRVSSTSVPTSRAGAGWTADWCTCGERGAPVQGEAPGARWRPPVAKVGSLPQL